MSWIRVVPAVIEVVVGIMERADEKREEHHRRAAERQERHNERQYEMERRGFTHLRLAENVRDGGIETRIEKFDDETKGLASNDKLKVKCQNHCEPVFKILLQNLSEQEAQTFSKVYPAFSEGYAEKAIEDGDIDGAYVAAIGSAALLASALQTARSSEPSHQ
jgi:hypothetical protein